MLPVGYFSLAISMHCIQCTFPIRVRELSKRSLHERFGDHVNAAGHDIPQDELDTALKAGQHFLALPTEVRTPDTCHTSQPALHRVHGISGH